MSEIVQWCVNCFFHPSMIVPYIKSQCITFFLVSSWPHSLSHFESFWVSFSPLLYNIFDFLGSGKSKKLKLLKNLVKMEFYKLVLKHFLKVLDHLRILYLREKLSLLDKKQSWNRRSKRKVISERKI